jgi:hypothetical protein
VVASGTHVRRDAIGSILGILVFLGGIALLLLVFRMAYEMFTMPPSNALGLKSAKAIDFNVVGNSLTTIVVRILLLLVMGVFGSLVANRGISMYTSSRAMTLKSDAKEAA